MSAGPLVALAALAAFAGEAERFAPGIVSSNYSEIRLTISPDGGTAAWFSRDRPGGAGGYDIWISRRTGNGWNAPAPAPFNSVGRDFDPAFSADGKWLYFSSNRAGGPGGDDVWRVRVTGAGFGEPEPLGAAVNSAANEWAPMLSPDGRTLLFSSDRLGGAGKMDLYTARAKRAGFAMAQPLPGAINTAEDEFDATFLGDGKTIVFTRAPDLRKDDVRLWVSHRNVAGYERGRELPETVNTRGGDAYAPMLDWSRPHRLTFTTRRPVDSPDGMDVWIAGYTWQSRSSPQR